VTDDHEPAYYLLCSACRTPCSGSEAHVIPHWHPEARKVFTTYRCGNCWLPSLDRMRAAVTLGEAEVLASFWEFLVRQGYTKDTAELRIAPMDQQQKILLAVLDAVQAGTVTFHP
jgi:hypothetical protein